MYVGGGGGAEGDGGGGEGDGGGGDGDGGGGEGDGGGAEGDGGGGGSWQMYPLREDSQVTSYHVPSAVMQTQSS